MSEIERGALSEEFHGQNPCFIYGELKKINILRHSRRFFRCACKALLPAAP
ncbi:hypothetical protein GPD45_002694 [Salmonella enterica]|nr:hypothetical protein [Salmonella enterica]